MKAIIKSPARAINANAHRREKYFREEIAAIDRKTGEALVSLRLYGSPSGQCNYACLWVTVRESKRRPSGLYANGSAKAGGYGYHRPSQAAQEAINAAGFTLDQDIAGVGDQAMTDAVHALAVAVGCRNPIIHRSHG